MFYRAEVQRLRVSLEGEYQRAESLKHALKVSRARHLRDQAALREIRDGRSVKFMRDVARKALEDEGLDHDAH